eukprot:11158694-Heterocapsa_arctica.AAC.1
MSAVASADERPGSKALARRRLRRCHGSPASSWATRPPLLAANVAAAAENKLSGGIEGLSQNCHGM